MNTWGLFGKGATGYTDTSTAIDDVFDGLLAQQAQALCAQTDPKALFPEKDGSIREAKAVCAQCKVCRQCLGYALANDERFGIWGGLSEQERRRPK